MKSGGSSSSCVVKVGRIGRLARLAQSKGLKNLYFMLKKSSFSALKIFYIIETNKMESNKRDFFFKSVISLRSGHRYCIAYVKKSSYATGCI